MAKTLSAVKNGAMLLSQANSLEAEFLKVKQRETDLDYTKRSNYKVLKHLLGFGDSSEIILDKSIIKKNEQFSFELRPELQLFDLQAATLTINKDLSFAKTLPKLSAFFQFGYGKPALNMLLKTKPIIFIFQDSV